jgi:hypothetical protein
MARPMVAVSMAPLTSKVMPLTRTRGGMHPRTMPR